MYMYVIYFQRNPVGPHLISVPVAKQCSAPPGGSLWVFLLGLPSSPNKRPVSSLVLNTLSIPWCSVNRCVSAKNPGYFL